MIEFSEKSTQIILEALKTLEEKIKNSSTNSNISVNEIQDLVQRIESNNEDRHIRNIWRSMLDRCRNPRNRYYSKYGERGICVCDEWHHLRNFREWCYANGYKFGLTVDRISNNGNYEPLNCRIVTQKEQQRNRRNNRMLVDPFDGTVLCMASMAEKYNIAYQVFANRINTQNLTVKEAITKPFRKKRNSTRPKEVNA